MDHITRPPSTLSSCFFKTQYLVGRHYYKLSQIVDMIHIMLLVSHYSPDQQFAAVMCQQTNKQVHLKKLEYHENIRYLSLISESDIHNIDSLQSEIFQAFYSCSVEDYGLKIIKTQNSVSKKIRIVHKVTHFKQKSQAFEKYVYFYALNTWLGLLLNELLNQCRVSWRRTACGTVQM